MRLSKGRYRQRIQAIYRASNSYYSEDIIISVLLCLIARKQPLLLKTRQEAVHELSGMLEQLIQDVFGLESANIDCSRLASPAELYYIMINRSREKKLRSHVTPVARANTVTTGAVSQSSSSTNMSASPTILNHSPIKELPQFAKSPARQRSIDERFIEADNTQTTPVGYGTRIEQFSNQSVLDKYSKDFSAMTFGGALEKNSPVSPRDQHHLRRSKQHRDPEIIPMQNLNGRKENDLLRQQKNPSVIYNSHIINSKKLANVIILEGLENTSNAIQSALLEVISKGWFVDRNNICHVPDPFIIIVLIPMNIMTSQMPRHLLDRFYLSYTYDGATGPMPQPSIKLPFGFSNEEVKEISQRAKNVIISPEISRYLRDLMVGIRLNRKFRMGASPRASMDLVSVLRSLAAIYEKTYVTPELVFIAINKVLEHRLFSSNALSKTYPSSDQGIVSDTLQLVWPPS